jgi:hypothetical protein
MQRFLMRCGAVAALRFGGVLLSGVLLSGVLLSGVLLSGVLLSGVVMLGGTAGAQDLIPQRGGLTDMGAQESVTRTAPLSMQSQLGAIPLVSPRAGARASLVRKVRLAQMVDGVQIGTAREIVCPETGCQHSVAFLVNQVPESFLLDVQFVTRGTYVALSSRSASIANVVEHRLGRPGPVFVKATGPVTEGTLSFATAPAASLRRLDVAQKDGRTLAQGNVYTRKREPDVVLRISVGAPEPAK